MGRAATQHAVTACTVSACRPSGAQADLETAHNCADVCPKASNLPCRHSKAARRAHLGHGGKQLAGCLADLYRLVLAAQGGAAQRVAAAAADLPCSYDRGEPLEHLGLAVRGSLGALVDLQSRAVEIGGIGVRINAYAQQRDLGNAPLVPWDRLGACSSYSNQMLAQGCPRSTTTYLDDIRGDGLGRHH